MSALWMKINRGYGHLKDPIVEENIDVALEKFEDVPLSSLASTCLLGVLQ